jgi:hypothetical protein
MQMPARRTDLLCREVDNELVILDRREDRIHQLNEAAGKVWDLCDGQHTPTQITESLVTLYEIPYATAEQDVLQTLENFAALGLLHVVDQA